MVAINSAEQRALLEAKKGSLAKSFEETFEDLIC